MQVSVVVSFISTVTWLTSTVITMASKKRNLVMNKNMMPDPSKIFSRALGLVTTGAITANEMFQYELAPYPTALF